MFGAYAFEKVKEVADAKKERWCLAAKGGGVVEGLSTQRKPTSAALVSPEVKRHALSIALGGGRTDLSYGKPSGERNNPRDATFDGGGGYDESSDDDDDSVSDGSDSGLDDSTLNDLNIDTPSPAAVAFVKVSVGAFPNLPPCLPTPD